MGKKKISVKKLLIVCLLWLLCGAAGYCLGKYVAATASGGWLSGREELYILLVILCVLVGGYCQIILHEGGHLVCGLLTGYGFSSFRVGNVMLVRKNGKLVFRKYSLAGTGGQCLMTPPDPVDGAFPVMLYNLGGPLANLICAVVSGLLYFLFPTGGLGANLCLGLAVSGIYLAALNGIPMQIGGIDNDGKNALSLQKNPAAMEAFWLQMKINDRISEGVRLKDMPEEWFTVPSEEDMKNPMVAARGVFACSRLLDRQDFSGAGELIDCLLESAEGMLPLHRNMLTCDRVYLELIGQRCEIMLDGLYTKELEAFMKAMKKSPSVLRTQYAYSLLATGDLEKAEKIRERFEAVAKTYPYPSDLQTDRELMEIAENTLNS